MSRDPLGVGRWVQIREEYEQRFRYLSGIQERDKPLYIADEIAPVARNGDATGELPFYDYTALDLLDPSEQFGRLFILETIHCVEVCGTQGANLVVSEHMIEPYLPTTSH